MGLFDHYRPTPDLACPVCQASQLEWQGKHGPCGLFVWQQGHAAPIDQLVDDDCQLSQAERAAKRLPTRFEIYAQCQCPTFLYAVGTVESGVWQRTELLSAVNAVPYTDESEREFKQRLAGLAKHSGHLA